MLYFGKMDLILLFTVLAFLILPFVAVILILTQIGTSSAKLLWFLVVVILPILGTVLYFLSGRRSIRKSTN